MEFKKIFLTGGSGFVGRNVIRHFKEKLGCEVVAIARSEEAAQAILAIGGQPARKVDLKDVNGMTEAARGCDVCIHCAADTTMWAKTDQQSHEINVTGTVNVINACKAAGVKRVIHISTENVLLTGYPLVNADETVPYPPMANHCSPYARTKRQAEIEAKALNGSGIDVVILRPRLIWGVDDTTVLSQIARAAKTGDLKWFDGGLYKTSTVHVKNLTFAMECAIRKGVPGEVYFVTDGQPVETKKFFTDLISSAGVPEVHRLGSIPLKLVWGVAVLLEGLGYITGRAPIVNRGALASIGVEITVSDAKARRDLGYHNVISIDEGLEEIRLAYQAQGISILDALAKQK